MKKELSVIEEATVDAEFSQISEKVPWFALSDLEDDDFSKRKREVKEYRKFGVNNHWKDVEIKQLTECMKKYGNDYD